MLRSLHDSAASAEDDPPFGTPTLLDDDTGLIHRSDINSDEGGGWANVGRFWLASVFIFAAAAFLLVAFCKRYGADLVDGWVNDRAHGDLSEESYFQRVLRRRAEREEAMKECPVKRKARLVKRLEEEGVVMVRSACCVLVGRKGRLPRKQLIIGDGDGPLMQIQTAKTLRFFDVRKNSNKLCHRTC